MDLHSCDPVRIRVDAVTRRIVVATPWDARRDVVIFLPGDLEHFPCSFRALYSHVRMFASIEHFHAAFTVYSITESSGDERTVEDREGKSAKFDFNPALDGEQETPFGAFGALEEAAINNNNINVRDALCRAR